MSESPNPLLSAVDNYNIANGSGSWFTSVAKGVGLGVPLAIAEGGLQLWNSTVVPLGNMVGGEGTIEAAQLSNLARSLDEDLGNYAEQNRSGIALGGFIAGSIVPGVAAVRGVRALQALKLAETGETTSFIAQATGLLRTTQSAHLDEAYKLIRAQDAPLKVIEANRLRALASGAGQSFLEAGAFELAVMATMSQSPILSEMNAYELGVNFATGLLIGGSIGTVFEAAKISGLINKASRQTDAENAPYKQLVEVPEGAAPPEVIAMSLWAQKLRSPIEGSERQMEMLAQRNARIDTQVKIQLRSLASGDEDVAQYLFETMARTSKTDQDLIGLFGALSKVGRISDSYIEDATGAVFLKKDLSREDLLDVLNPGRPQTVQDLFASKESLGAALGKSSAGYMITKPLRDINLAVWGKWSDEILDGQVFPSMKRAFDEGFDVYYHKNRQLSINPMSKAFKRFDPKVAQKDDVTLVSTEDGKSYPTAIPTLADLATAAHPLTITQDLVSVAGRQFFNRLEDTSKVSPADLKNVDTATIQARHIWALENKYLRIEKDAIIDEHDFSLLEKLIREPTQGVKLRLDLEGETYLMEAPTGVSLIELVSRKKGEIADQLLRKGMDERDVALRLNTSTSWLSKRIDEDGLVKWDKKAPPEGMRESELKYWKQDYLKPAYITMKYDTSKLIDENAVARIKGELDVATYQKQYADVAKNNFSNYVGEDAKLFPEAPKNLPAPDRLGAGSGLIMGGHYAFGSMGEFVSFVGSQLQALTERKIKVVQDTLISVAQKITFDTSGKLGAELGSFYEVARRNVEVYVPHPLKPNTVVARGLAEEIESKISRVDSKRKPYEALSEDLPVEISLDPAVFAFLKAHAQLNATRQNHKSNIKALVGDVREPSKQLEFYIPPLNPKDYKHYVWVIPKDAMNLSRSLLVAPDENTLRQMIEKIPKEFDAITAAQIKNRKDFYNDFDYELSMSDGFVDSTLKRNGLFSRYAPITDGKVLAQEMLDWHSKQEIYLAREMVSSRYAELTTTLNSHADQFKNLQESQLRGIGKTLESQMENPYLDYLKVMLNISRRQEYKDWTSFNELARNAVEKPFAIIRAAMTKTNFADDGQVAEFNSTAKSMGLGTPFQDAAMAMLTNIHKPAPWLPSAIGRVQGLLSGMVLNLDPLQAMNTIVSAPIMYSMEMRTLLKEVFKSPEAAADYKALTSLNVPGQVAADGSPLQVPSMWRLLSNAVQNYSKDAMGTMEGLSKGALLERYKKNRSIPDARELQNERQAVDGLTLDFSSNNYSLALDKISKAEAIILKKVAQSEDLIATGRRWTGNDFAENFTRFIAADVARQVGELGVARGVMSPDQLDILIYNFVTRVNGTYQASQRPMIFQGVVGQTMALWQTYTFNMLQRLMINTQEGQGKSAAMLFGIQGSLYGMQGLPGFSYLNTHIVGNAAGNPEHKDLYTATYGTFGKDTGDWLMYGMGSNALGLLNSSLKFNLYTRGDINPRQWTILPNPTSPTELPIISITSKFFGGLYQSLTNVKNGGDLWSSFTQGIEHASINRPLAGLAQVIQGYTTTGKGSLLVANDMWSAASAVRIAGGKPFDESIALDALYRMNAYNAADKQRLQNLGAAVKSTLIGGRDPDPEQAQQFLQSYVSAGGRLENFNGFMVRQMKSANISQVNILRDQLQKPIARNLQQIMGGEPLQDFVNSPPQAEAQSASASVQ